MIGYRNSSYKWSQIFPRSQSQLLLAYTYSEWVGFFPRYLCEWQVVGLGVSGLRQWLGNCDDDEEDVDYSNGGRQRYHESVTVHAAKVRADSWARHQAGGKCRRHLHSICIIIIIIIIIIPSPSYCTIVVSLSQSCQSPETKNRETTVE